jgi:hypothetical protein
MKATEAIFSMEIIRMSTLNRLRKVVGMFFVVAVALSAVSARAQVVNCGPAQAGSACIQGPIGTVYVPDRLVQVNGAYAVRDCYFVNVGGTYYAVKTSDEVMFKEVRTVSMLAKATGGIVQIYSRGTVNCGDCTYVAIVGFALL